MVQGRESETEQPTALSPSQQKKIALVIEDDRSVSLMLARMLLNLGFEASRVSSAESADDFLAIHSADLILLDLGLPGKSGEAWLHSFRRINPDIPIIAVSVVTDPLRRAALLHDGADDFISKPFELPEVEARICALLRRPRLLSEAAVCEGTVHLDPRRSELRVGAVRMSLTAREFGILWELALFEGKWVLARTLCAAVLGGSTKAHMETMRVHVSNLRHKLSHLAHIFVVESERLVGYRIMQTKE